MRHGFASMLAEYGACKKIKAPAACHEKEGFVPWEILAAQVTLHLQLLCPAALSPEGQRVDAPVPDQAEWTA
jgi:hypothetical protein